MPLPRPQLPNIDTSKLFAGTGALQQVIDAVNGIPGSTPAPHVPAPATAATREYVAKLTTPIEGAFGKYNCRVQLTPCNNFSPTGELSDADLGTFGSTDNGIFWNLAEVNDPLGRDAHYLNPEVKDIRVQGVLKFYDEDGKAILTGRVAPPQTMMRWVSPNLEQSFDGGTTWETIVTFASCGTPEES